MAALDTKTGSAPDAARVLTNIQAVAAGWAGQRADRQRRRHLDPADFARLREANTTFNEQYAGDLPARQPIHTVYGGAQIFNADSAGKLGAVALKSRFGRWMGLTPASAVMRSTPSTS